MSQQAGPHIGGNRAEATVRSKLFHVEQLRSSDTECSTWNITRGPEGEKQRFPAPAAARDPGSGLLVASGTFRNQRFGAKQLPKALGWPELFHVEQFEGIPAEMFHMEHSARSG